MDPQKRGINMGLKKVSAFREFNKENMLCDLQFKSLCTNFDNETKLFKLKIALRHYKMGSPEKVVDRFYSLNHDQIQRANDIEGVKKFVQNLKFECPAF